MRKLLIGGAGGAPAENVILSLSEGLPDCYICGIGSEPADLILSSANVKYQVPYAIEPSYKRSLLEVIKREKPVFAHFQNDFEIREISRFRADIKETGTNLYMPSKEVIENCVDKSKTSEIWQKEGIRVPKTIRIIDEDDLKRAFRELNADKNGNIWFRAAEGGGGKGALPTNSFVFAKHWIDRFQGWGAFTAAEMLTENSVTWSSIWFRGELVVAQTRKRNAWNFGNRTLSGVTGITRVGETFSSDMVNRVAVDSIFAVDREPHGIFSVDMTYDHSGIPNPTEINISRFFTTIYFFTKAGLNMPKIYTDIALNGSFPSLERKINPLKDGLLWIRGMDRTPLLIDKIDFNEMINQEVMP